MPEYASVYEVLDCLRPFMWAQEPEPFQGPEGEPDHGLALPAKVQQVVKDHSLAVPRRPQDTQDLPERSFETALGRALFSLRPGSGPFTARAEV